MFSPSLRSLFPGVMSSSRSPDSDRYLIVLDMFSANRRIRLLTRSPFSSLLVLVLFCLLNVSVLGGASLWSADSVIPLVGVLVKASLWIVGSVTLLFDVLGDSSLWSDEEGIPLVCCVCAMLYKDLFKYISLL